MARDIVQNALLEAKRAREVAMENAKDILIESLSPRLERVLNDKFRAIAEEDEVRVDDGAVAADVDSDGDADEWADGAAAGEATGVDLTETEDELDPDYDYELENDEYGGDKGDESRSRRDYEEDIDIDEPAEVDLDVENDEYGGDKGDESKSRRDYEEAYVYEDEDELDIDIEEDDEYGGDKGDESRSRRDYEENFDLDEDDEEDELEEIINRHLGRKNESRNARKIVKERNALRKANKILTKELRESNLFNVKLSHALRLLESNGGALTGNQRKSIVASLDRAKTVREAHLIARSIHESLKVAEAAPRRKRIHESASRKTRVAGLINETTGTDRWSKLAGITS